MDKPFSAKVRRRSVLKDSEPDFHALSSTHHQRVHGAADILGTAYHWPQKGGRSIVPHRWRPCPAHLRSPFRKLLKQTHLKALPPLSQRQSSLHPKRPRTGLEASHITCPYLSFCQTCGTRKVSQVETIMKGQAFGS